MICQALVSQDEDTAGQQTYPLACAGPRAEGSLKQRCNIIEEIRRGISY